MIHRGIPSTGEMLPVIGMGTWATFDVGDNPARRKVLAEGGGSLIDSSPMYGSSNYFNRMSVVQPTRCAPVFPFLPFSCATKAGAYPSRLP